jgi:hypothetical protein
MNPKQTARLIHDMNTAAPWTKAAILEYFVDASEQLACDVYLPNGDEFWRVRDADVHAFPELASTFGVRLRPNGVLDFLPTQLDYMFAVADNCI